MALGLGLGFGLAQRRPSGPTYGPELVPNGTFTTDTTGWTPNNATLAVVGGQMQVTTTAAGGYATTLVSGLTIGASYRLRATMTPQDSSDWASIALTGGNTTEFFYRATTGGNLDATISISGVAAINIQTRLHDSVNGFSGVGATALFDNISLKKIN